AEELDGAVVTAKAPTAASPQPWPTPARNALGRVRISPPWPSGSPYSMSSSPMRRCTPHWMAEKSPTRAKMPVLSSLTPEALTVRDTEARWPCSTDAAVCIDSSGYRLSPSVVRDVANAAANSGSSAMSDGMHELASTRRSASSIASYGSPEAATESASDSVSVMATTVAPDAGLIPWNTPKSRARDRDGWIRLSTCSTAFSWWSSSAHLTSSVMRTVLWNLNGFTVLTV